MSKMNAQQLLLLMAVVIGVFFVVSCSNQIEPNIVEKKHSQFTESAIDYFEKHQHIYTRSRSQIPTEKTPYILGEFAPDWNTETSIANDAKIYSDFELTKESRFVLFPGYDVDVASVELHSQFVSIIDYKNDTINQYVATYIPSPEYISTYVEELENGLFNCEHLSDFSGVILHTTPTGYHISATRYANGIRTAHAFLYNKEQDREENIRDFLNIMDDISVGIITKNIGNTRSDDVVYGGEIELIEIVYHKLEFTSIELLEDVYDEDNYIVDTLIDNFGIGGGASSEEEKEKDEKFLNAKEFTNKILKNNLSTSDSLTLHIMLEEILSDCMGRNLLTKIYDNNIQIDITFDTNSGNNSRYCYNSNIKNSSIVMSNSHSEGLLHELYHFYQHFTYGYNIFQQANVNFEVEAHLASVIYMSLPTNTDAHSRFDKYIDTTLGSHLYDCSLWFDKQYIGNDSELSLDNLSLYMFNDSFQDTAWYYQDKHKNLNYDTQRNVIESLKDLLTFYIECL